MQSAVAWHAVAQMGNRLSAARPGSGKDAWEAERAGSAIFYPQGGALSRPAKASPSKRRLAPQAKLVPVKPGREELNVIHPNGAGLDLSRGKFGGVR